jgi:phosphotransferase system enzyme I (PtsP)
VHLTSLRYGEGLVGEVASLAAPLNLAEATTHPKYAYREETGEEQYHSFVGVPILYHHKVIGVLVVQSADVRIYSDEEVEILQTIAMVLAELAVGSSVVKLDDVTGHDEAHRASHYFSGLKIAPGLAKAPAVLHRPRIEITKLVTDNPSFEEERLQHSLGELQRSIDDLMARSSLAKDEQKLEIIETYRMFTQDRGWLERILEAIRTGLTAEAAVKKVEEEMHARMQQIESTYIRDRMQDLEDLSNRLLYHLAGISPTAAQGDLPEQFILVAKSIGPAELLEYHDKSLVGVMVEEGSTGSHVAIIARMMDIPMVAGIRHAATLVKAEDIAIVDGDNGEAYIRPPADVEEAIELHLGQRQEEREAYAAQQDLPAETKDGHIIALNLSIGLHLDASAIRRPDVHGIGLYRTELPYLASSDIPDVDEQKQMYTEVFRQALGKPIIFRSFDIGGDKNVPYLDAGYEENPAMGWRATRVGLDRPVILRRQFRALIRAASGQTLYIMYPFIATVEEYDDVNGLFERELERAKVEGVRLPSGVFRGCMLEIPSLLYQLDDLFRRVDFVSVGSNDLLQFMYASDRGSARLSGRYDPLAPFFLRVLRDVNAKAREADVEVGFCGAMASKPLEAMALMGAGLTHLSVPISAAGPVKAMIRSLPMMELRAEMDEWLSQEHHSVRARLEQFAKRYAVVL